VNARAAAGTSEDGGRAGARPAPPVLELREARVRRGDFIVAAAHLEVHAGERLVVMGPNGAGKSTLLLALGGLVPLQAGTRWLDGRRAPPGRALRRAVTTALQQPLLLDASVRHNVELPLRWRGLGAAERAARAERWLAALGVAGLAARHAAALSGGERQRVHLARALATEPRALLLDEPFAAIDAPGRPGLRADLARALAASGAAAVIVTHDREEAIALGDRMAVMLRGTLRQVGTPAEVFRAPADLEVAALVGVENVWAARVVRAEGDLVEVALEGAAGGATVRALAPAGPLAPGAAVHACLRPDDVLLFAADARLDAASARNRLGVRVDAVAPSDRHVRVTVRAGALGLVAYVSRAAADELALRAGGEALAVFKAASVHLVT
jgi:molybdopterin-binding protein